eukprot:scaffold52060_cov73-Phaeocystis_antarctica.AAC.1
MAVATALKRCMCTDLSGTCKNHLRGGCNFQTMIGIGQDRKRKTKHFITTLTLYTPSASFIPFSPHPPL